MNNFIRLAAVIVVSLATSGNAMAEAEEGEFYISIMGSYVDHDAQRGLVDEVNGGQFGLGYALNDRWNIEGMISVANNNSTDPAFGPREDHRGIGVDVLRIFRPSATFRPYLHAGVGSFRNDSDVAIHSDGAMYSAGVGFLMNVFGDRTAIRGEWRHRNDRASNLDMDDNIFSLGVQVPFGKSSPKFVDSDGDGVADSMDRCPNTPAGIAVDSNGCERDSDGDGVKDSMDKCPGTPSGVRVDAKGCALDSDGDGVRNGLDKCPGTPAGAKVNAAGCELDSDKDGVVDRLDECPGTAAGVLVDIKGCEIKAEIKLPGVNFESNSDRLLPGASDVLDDAAATLRKNPSIEVEVAGYTDSDGAADYNESLSARRAKTVHDYLLANGVADDRMSVRGYGESQPIADNSTAIGKAQNRRVVLRILDR